MSIFGIFNSLTQVQKYLVTAILALILFTTSAGITFSVATSMKKPTLTDELSSSLPSASKAYEEEANEPKTESCPLNGSLHTKKARENWEKRRPLAVMIENHQEARPQSGLSKADIIYEAVAEGGITRFMAVFYCSPGDYQVGPVRSARIYYLDWLGEYNALYAHVGGANMPGPADALGQIIKYGVKDLNQFSIGFPTFWRDYQRLGHPVATEHTMYSTTQKLWEVGAKRGWTNVDKDGVAWDANFTAWKFKDDSPGGSTTEINVNFWQDFGDYSVKWIYVKDCNCYKRKNGGTDHLDLNSNRQLETKNIIIQFERESNANDGYPGNVHLLYKTIGSGKALLFLDGQVIEGTWNKPSRVTRTRYQDLKGNEILFNRGVIWIDTVPEGAKVSY